MPSAASTPLHWKEPWQLYQEGTPEAQPSAYLQIRFCIAGAAGRHPWINVQWFSGRLPGNFWTFFLQLQCLRCCAGVAAWVVGVCCCGKATMGLLCGYRLTDIQRTHLLFSPCFCPLPGLERRVGKMAFWRSGRGLTLLLLPPKSWVVA